MGSDALPLCPARGAHRGAAARRMLPTVLVCSGLGAPAMRSRRRGGLSPPSPLPLQVVVFGTPDESRLQQGLEGEWERPEVLAALVGLQKPTGRCEAGVGG